MQLINPYQFQEIVKQWANDISLLWNPTIERFQVFQTAVPVLELPAMSQREQRQNKLRLLFTIEDEFGEYRDPDESDLVRVRQAVETVIDVSVKGYEQLADRMEKADDERENSIAPGVQDAMMWGAQEMYKIRSRKGIMGFN